MRNKIKVTTLKSIIIQTPFNLPTTKQKINKHTPKQTNNETNEQTKQAKTKHKYSN